MLTWCWTSTRAQLPRDYWADAVLEGLTSLPRACLQLLDERAENPGSSASSRSGDGGWLEAEPLGNALVSLPLRHPCHIWGSGGDTACPN